MGNIRKYLSLGILLIVIASAGCTGPSNEVTQEAEVTQTELTFFIGSCMAPAVAEMLEVFYAQNPGVNVTLVTRSSEVLIRNIGEWEEGDVFMAGAGSFAEEAIELGYMESYSPVSDHKTVMIVPKGNPLGLKTLEDITDDNIRVIMSTGKMVLTAVEETDVYEEIMDNHVFIEETKCSRMPQSVDEGLADVAIACLPSANRVDGVEYIEVPELNRPDIIPIGVLEFSENKELAQKFVDIVVSDFGKSEMEKHGFGPLEG